ncbi:MAG: phosphotransacetylase family protein [Desulfomicrobium sp.]|nr:phosphotransacetylase family protein [Pseudomonadota bacterium]MBV1714236.1 phosphotransacetylase family protein [Desulfomicrobium sp.]MBU4570975.1 phosphotransacetylase family protein [Pseudomonadota bacterium]MBU4594593.1 phosphotransacetylase family protein [Pseudomonadota bacterium]MBV1721778.1 phosphotransacetylase family protein [Desulfomicrobium sp.]
MVGIYVGATSGYSGKNMIAMGIGLKLQKEGYRVGYMKPVGALPQEKNGVLGDADAFFVQDILGLSEDPTLVTPVVVDQDFKIKAFTGKCEDLMPRIKSAYEQISKDKDITIVAGSGSMYSGKYCGVDGVSVVKALGIKSMIIDRYVKELNYDYLIAMKELLGDQLLGVLLNDIPPVFKEELDSLLHPFMESKGIKVLGKIPSDPLMGAIKVADLADRLGGKIITAQDKSERVVENFLIGTMQVENFMTHFRKSKKSAIIVGGDRSDVQLVALEGQCQCLVLTGNLYPNDIIMTRAEVLEVPIVVVRDDTFTVAKKMEAILSRHKLRDVIKIQHGSQLVSSIIDFQFMKEKLGI